VVDQVISETAEGVRPEIAARFAERARGAMAAQASTSAETESTSTAH